MANAFRFVDFAYFTLTTLLPRAARADGHYHREHAGRAWHFTAILHHRAYLPMACLVLLLAISNFATIRSLTPNAAGSVMSRRASAFSRPTCHLPPLARVDSAADGRRRPF